jgi:hypothetical protein
LSHKPFGLRDRNGPRKLAGNERGVTFPGVPTSLTVKILHDEAIAFAKEESKFREPSLYGVTDGKAVGTYLEHKFQAYLQNKYQYARGSSAKGIDFPELDVDIKVTSIRQPQSSCPFKSARQKIYGLGYSLLVFVYDKHDDEQTRTGRLELQHTIFVAKERTADYQITVALRRMIESGANRDDILACFEERLLPVDNVEAVALADEVLRNPPQTGYLTISNALQWRLQYSRVIEQAGKVEGVLRLE